MAPFRQPPRQSMPAPGDGAEVRKWFARRDRFSSLPESELWPPPPVTPFSSTDIDALAISGNGARALLFANQAAWLVDTETLQTRRFQRPRGSIRIAALSDEGELAVFIHQSTIYVWDLAAPEREPEAMWQSSPLGNIQFLSMSRDGKTVAAGNASRTGTIRIFDTERKTLTYSFEEDIDEGLCLHPDGQHIVCFGDDGFARIYGADGVQHKLGSCSGGAISRDGTRMLTTNRSDRQGLLLYRLNASAPRMAVSPPQELSVGFKVDTSTTRIRFSPSGNRALVEGYDENAYLIDLESERITFLDRVFPTGSGFVADESRVWLGPSRHDREFPRDVIVVHGIAGADARIGAIAASDERDRVCLVGTSPLGFFGSLEVDEHPVGTASIENYERPEIMASILGGTELALSAADELRAQEVADRAEVWKPFLAHLTADIDLDSLMELNKGIVHLTEAITERARRLDEGVVRFGKFKLSWDALTRASASIRAMTMMEQERLFDETLTRLRSQPSRDAALEERTIGPQSSNSVPTALEVRESQAIEKEGAVGLVIAVGGVLAIVLAVLTYALL